MATLEEVYEKVASDDEEKKALAQALTSKESVEAFLAERGCGATPEELVTLFREKAGVTGEASDEVLGDVAGGTGWDWVASICTIGIGCAVIAIQSHVYEKNGETTGSGDLGLCSAY